jgi:hypothetical protein
MSTKVLIALGVLVLLPGTCLADAVVGDFDDNSEPLYVNVSLSGGKY